MPAVREARVINKFGIGLIQHYQGLGGHLGQKIAQAQGRNDTAGRIIGRTQEYNPGPRSDDLIDGYQIPTTTGQWYGDDLSLEQAADRTIFGKGVIRHNHLLARRQKGRGCHHQYLIAAVARDQPGFRQLMMSRQAANQVVGRPIGVEMHGFQVQSGGFTGPR